MSAYPPALAHLTEAKAVFWQLAEADCALTLRPDGKGATSRKTTLEETEAMRRVGPQIREYIRWETLTVMAMQSPHDRETTRRFDAEKRWLPSDEEIAAHEKAFGGFDEPSWWDRQVKDSLDYAAAANRTPRKAASVSRTSIEVAGEIRRQPGQPGRQRRGVAN